MAHSNTTVQSEKPSVSFGHQTESKGWTLFDPFKEWNVLPQVMIYEQLKTGKNGMKNGTWTTNQNSLCGIYTVESSMAGC